MIKSIFKSTGKIFYLFLMLICLSECNFISFGAYAGELPNLAAQAEETLESFPIKEIVINGLEQTDPEVIKNNLLFQVGSVFSFPVLHESLQRLRNRRVFRSVSSSAVLNNDHTVTVTLNIIEKWTLIPIVRGGVGGGTHFYVLGAYDLNLFGKFLDMGIQYENYGGTSSQVGWYRDPNFLNKNIEAKFEPSHLNRRQIIYNSEGDIRGAYLLTRSRGFLMLDREILEGFRLGLGAEILKDFTSFQLLAGELERANAEFMFVRPENSFVTLVKGHMQFGRLNFDDFFVDGFLADVALEGASDKLGSTTSLVRSTFQVNWFRRLGQIHNFGFRLSGGISNARLLQHMFSVGGLENIRGLYDGQFLGDRFWATNLEYRVPSFVLQKFDLQHVFFVDAGGAGMSWAPLVPGKRTLGVSSGVGVRLIFPFIARFNIRADYAWAFSPRFHTALVAGMQQFF